MLTAQTIVQSLASGLLMGLLYGLIAVGLALIFGLMDVVNFAHGEFLMAAMYATLGCAVFLALDPLLAAPVVAAALFAFGALVYLGVVRFEDSAHPAAGDLTEHLIALFDPLPARREPLVPNQHLEIDAFIALRGRHREPLCADRHGAQ